MLVFNAVCLLAVLSQTFAAKPLWNPLAASTDLELRKRVFSKIGHIRKERVAFTEGSSEGLRAQADDDTSNVGYLMVSGYFNYPSTGECKGSESIEWIKYGICIISGDGTDSYRTSLSAPASDGSYTLKTTSFSNPACDTNGGSGVIDTDTVLIFMNECEEGGYMTSLTDAYTPLSSGVNEYNYNYLEDCEAGGYDNVISAIYIPTGVCIPSGTVDSVKYNDCYTETVYEGTTVCDKKTAIKWYEYTGSTNIFSQTTCLADEGGYGYYNYDDSTLAVSYYLSSCNSASSAASSVASVAQFGLIGVAFSTVLVLWM